ncbi:hypothetical protein [Diatraea saccharalis granulovirus]|uniref:Uncharacterized protein n=1 Tax=Diatraea saccharalis granulovirus TaxID=1675862 RepID=A0A0R7EZ03_9BBAC|nr:hypothetical protein [Diatraea saccharalis granulovirus]AKN80814.1 hypothetical protein [Diatraea saccharalis granulovirus]
MCLFKWIHMHHLAHNINYINVFFNLRFHYSRFVFILLFESDSFYSRHYSSRSVLCVCLSQFI